MKKQTHIIKLKFCISIFLLHFLPFSFNNVVAGEHTKESGELTIKIEKRYLNLPISETSQSDKMTLSLDGKMLTWFKIKLAKEEPNYWMHYDVSNFLGKTITLSYEGDVESLNKIYQDDKFVGQDKIYQEEFRPQFHFSTMRGWINDPNGLVYYDGEYHLFYQHNPYDVDWGNLNWGHAVSRDLVNWEELPTALQIDELGEMYSGSAVVDYDNTSGLGKKDKPAMLAFYTVQCSDGQTQCMAYSLDKGRTWTKYKNNPILDTKMKGGTWHNRDPKVFWYEADKHWVMVLHEKDGHSIYTSDNMLNWEYQSHTSGFWECPELFELPIDGNKDNTKWVMSGASGTYMIGSFDGKTFTPETGKHYYASGYLYAPQTFNNIPAEDGRRIQVSWASIRHENMPFTGHMLLPVELSLRTTKDGVRMVCIPVNETKELFTPLLNEQLLTMQEANEKLNILLPSVDCLRVKGKIRLSHPTNAGMILDGQKILDYDMNFNRINGTFYSPQNFTSMELDFDLYIDRTSIEGFIDDGLYSFIIERKGEGAEKGISFWGLQDLTVEELTVYSVKSIW